MPYQKKKKALILTSDDQLREKRSKQAKTNKTRSKSMENRIAKYLHGKRVPMSGAAAGWKGDVTIPYANGTYLIECKMSAATTPRNEPTMRIEFRWFAKIAEEAIAMKAKFSVVIIHYHNYPEDIVFINVLDFAKLVKKHKLPLEGLVDILPRIDMTTNSTGKMRTGINLPRQVILDSFVTEMGYKAFIVEFPISRHIVMTLSQFREIMEQVDNAE